MKTALSSDPDLKIRNESETDISRNKAPFRANKNAFPFKKSKNGIETVCNHFETILFSSIIVLLEFLTLSIFFSMSSLYSIPMCPSVDSWKLSTLAASVTLAPEHNTVHYSFKRILMLCHRTRSYYHWTLVHKLIQEGPRNSIIHRARENSEGARTRQAAIAQGLATHYAWTDFRKYIFAVRVVDKWNRIPESVRTAQGKGGLQARTPANQTVKQRWEVSKDGNSSDTKESKKNNDRWKATMTPRS